MRKIVFVVLIVLFSLILNAIEVGGHLTEDTTWSPDNNPYLVTSGVYVDSGVTLTIQPGTIVKFNSGYYDDLSDDEFYFHNGEEPIAKFMRVEGRIIAEGTEQDSIIFTRMQNEEYFHWGTIYLPEGSEQSSFKHCVIEYSAVTGFSLSEQIRAAVAAWNGKVSIENCSFIENDTAVSIERNIIEVSIIDNLFDFVEFPHPAIQNVSGMYFFRIRYISNMDTGIPLIAGNIFNNGTSLYLSHTSVTFVKNTIVSVPFNRDGMYLSHPHNRNYIFNNEFGSCDKGISSLASEEDTIYIKSNYFATNGDGVRISNAYVEINDNYFEGCGVNTEFASGKVYNNISKGGEFWTPSEIEIANNICYNNLDGYGLKVGYNPYCVNNISINNEYAIWGKTVTYENCIILGNEDLTQHYVSGDPVFRNCIIDFPLDPPLIDAGGNIIIDSLQAQSIFEDIQNGDFHLAPGSIAIDAGFDTLGYYYPFDMDYNHRVWDGDNNGSAIIDIGPYEYGAPALGGIEGITYDPITGDIVDYVLININNEPGEFTFSDSVGNYQYKLPEGAYDVFAERVFYDDAVEYQIEVIDGQFTQLEIPMYKTVDVQDYEIIPVTNDFDLSNFPNPFNPSTNISFSMQNNSKVELSIFNIKGQKITTLINEQLSKGKHSFVWSGCDQNSHQVSSGIYFYKLKVGNQESVKRMLLLK